MLVCVLVFVVMMMMMRHLADVCMCNIHLAFKLTAARWMNELEPMDQLHSRIVGCLTFLEVRKRRSFMATRTTPSVRIHASHLAKDERLRRPTRSRVIIGGTLNDLRMY